MSRKTYRKIIVNEQLLAQINPENIRLQKEYLREKNAKSSDLTIRGYSSDLDIFWVWNLQENGNKFFVDIKKLEFSYFFSYCIEELKWGSARFARVRSVLSGLSLFIEKYYDSEYPKFRNVILNTVDLMPKNLVRTKTILTEEQIKFLFSKLEDKPQEALWLATAIASGARFSEIFRLEIDNIDENNIVLNNMFIETLHPISTKGRGKKGKIVHKYIIRDIFLPYYKAFLSIRQEIMKKNNVEHNSIFINEKTGQPATPAIVRTWIKHFESILNQNVYPHCFRHYTTTLLARASIPYDLIKYIFQWESVEMISVYNDLSAKDREWKELNNLKQSLQK